MKLFTSRLLLGLALTASPLTTGCGKKDAPPAAPSSETTAPADPAAGKTDGEQGSPRREPEPAAPTAKAETVPALPGPFATAALNAVPKTAPFVMVGSLKKVLDGFGYTALMEKYGPMMASVNAQVIEVTGKDLTKLSSWAEIGVDLDSPMGTFMPDMETNGLVTFVQLSDAAKFAGFLNETAKKAGAPIASEKVGEATLFTVGDRDREALLIKGSFLYVVNLMRGNGAAALAKELVTRAEADSIVALPELKSSLDGLAADEAGLFVQLKTVLEKSVLDRMGGSTKLASQYGDQLAAAKTAGDAAEIARLEAALADEKVYFDRIEKRRAAELELAKSIVSELSTFVVGFDVAESSVEAHMRLPLTQGGMLSGLFKNASEMQPVLKLTKDQPLFALSGQIDPAQYMKLFEKVLAADGVELAEVRAGMKEFGVDLDEVVGTLSGELGLALTGDMATIMASANPQNEMGGAFILGLKSDASIKALIGKLAAQQGVGEFAKWDEATSTLTLTPPGQKPVQVVFANNRLIATTDLDAVTRLAGSDSFVASLANPKLKALLERKDLAGLFAMPQSFGAVWLMGKGNYARFTPPMPEGASAEVKAKYEQLAKLDAEIAPLRAKVEEQQMKPVLDAFAKLGTFAQGLSLDAQGSASTMGIYTTAPVPEVIATLVDLAMTGTQRGGEQSEDDKRLRELEDQRWKLESELMAPKFDAVEIAPDPK